MHWQWYVPYEARISNANGNGLHCLRHAVVIQMAMVCTVLMLMQWSALQCSCIGLHCLRHTMAIVCKVRGTQ